MTAMNRRIVLGGIAALSIPNLGRAQRSYPNRQISLIVPWPAGGSADLTARAIGQAIAGPLGQPIVVENRSGATGTIGHAFVARAQPDGYTLLQATASTYAIARHLLGQLPYDDVTDFSPVIVYARSGGYLLCVNPSWGVSSLEEFIARVRSQPGAVNFSSTSVGSLTHLTMELLISKFGLQMTHIPYRGGAPSAQAVMSGEVQVAFIDTLIAHPYVQAGTIRPLAITRPERSPVYPTVPTFKEHGIDGLASADQSVILAPARTPRPIIELLNRTIDAQLKTSALRDLFASFGVEATGSDPDAYFEVQRESSKRWGALIRANGIRG